jgi:hypothetical protein
MPTYVASVGEIVLLLASCDYDLSMLSSQALAGGAAILAGLSTGFVVDPQQLEAATGLDTTLLSRIAARLQEVFDEV